MKRKHGCTSWFFLFWNWQFNFLLLHIYCGMKANIISAASINHAIAICELTKVVSRSNWLWTTVFSIICLSYTLRWYNWIKKWTNFRYLCPYDEKRVLANKKRNKRKKRRNPSKYIWNIFLKGIDFIWLGCLVCNNLEQSIERKFITTNEIECSRFC